MEIRIEVDERLVGRWERAAEAEGCSLEEYLLGAIEKDLRGGENYGKHQGD